jgi:hypothetical protein
MHRVGNKNCTENFASKTDVDTEINDPASGRQTDRNLLLLPSSDKNNYRTLKMQVAYSSETFVTTDQPTRRHNNLHIYRRQTLKSDECRYNWEQRNPVSGSSHTSFQISTKMVEITHDISLPSPNVMVQCTKLLLRCRGVPGYVHYNISWFPSITPHIYIYIYIYMCVCVCVCFRTASVV